MTQNQLPQAVADQLTKLKLDEKPKDSEKTLFANIVVTKAAKPGEKDEIQVRGFIVEELRFESGAQGRGAAKPKRIFFFETLEEAWARFKSPAWA